MINNKDGGVTTNRQELRAVFLHKALTAITRELTYNESETLQESIVLVIDRAINNPGIGRFENVTLTKAATSEMLYDIDNLIEVIK